MTQLCITYLLKAAVIKNLEADPSKCVAEGPGIRSAEVNTTTTFTISVKDHLNKPCTFPHQLTTTLRSLVDGSVVETTQTSKDEATYYEVLYTATQRGRHQLSVAVNDVEIHGSPFAVFIKMPPTQLGPPVQVIKGLNRPYCIAINSDSDLIVSDFARMSHKICVYTRRGEKKHEFGKGKEEFKHPTGVAVDKSDRYIFVADSDNHCIQKFTRDGLSMKLVGGPMSGSGHIQFNDPRGLKLNDNKLYVCDSGNHRIQVFDTELNYITSIGGEGSGPGQFNRPWDVSFDDSSMLHVADNYNHRIQVLDQDGKYVREYGQRGSDLGQLNRPAFIHVDHDYVYVSEWDNQRVSLFTTNGRFVHAITNGEPFGVAVDIDGFVYVCDYHNNRVQVF